MQQHYFINPFAVNGNVTAIPEGTDPNGYVSYNQGFTFDYQRVLGTDSLAKQIQRQTINQVLLDVTTALQDIQQYSTSEFIDTSDNGGTAFGYDIGAIVRYSSSGTSPFGLYISLVAGNTTTPGTAGSWRTLTYGAYLGQQLFYNNGTSTLTGTFAPAVGTGFIEIEMIGAGAPGGGCVATASGNSAAALGGSGGTYLKGIMLSNFNGVPYSIGGGIAGTTGSGSNASPTTFGSSGNQFTAPGGIGGSIGNTAPSNNAGSYTAQAGLGTGSGTAVLLVSSAGNLGFPQVIVSPGTALGQRSGSGGAGPFGGGAPGVLNGNGVNGTEYGSGGSGAASYAGNGPYSGGNGKGGLILIRQFSG